MSEQTAKSLENATVEEKLRSLYELQLIDTKINEIKTLRGELPLEVQDLEDEIAGLETRLTKLDEEIKGLKSDIVNKKQEIVNSNDLIKKYTEQQNNVRNNREYDALSKEIEYQKLEIELCEKRIKEYTQEEKNKEEFVGKSDKVLEERKSDLAAKKTELDSIVAETQKEEDELKFNSEDLSAKLEERLVVAYTRIKNNARNGLAVVTVERDACGGCFNKIPPQRQLDIRSRKKIIVCEYCGRILVDKYICEKDNTREEEDKLLEAKSKRRTTRRKADK